ncbi:MAG: iron-sulfur cluster assembly scaffold protein [Candidatus Levybacteria bacterium]|nr:iron-sulfur cluster assembly scaffold protein [Candidatus Levybacteria bacterium]
MDNYLYREEILDHYKDPHNFGKPHTFDISSMQYNPFCGDEIELFVSTEDDTVRDIHFKGKGCAISLAAASMLTDFAKGKKKTALTKFSQHDMLDLLEIELSETRKKCALLGWAVLQDCLK